MFNPDFYPTPPEVIEIMLEGINLAGKTVLEPSAGKGNIVDHLLTNGAEILACELNDDLREILKSKCKIIGSDFLALESHQISHINLIVMNPPFSADEKHILHAYEIAPAGCKIIALANLQTINNPYSLSRKYLKKLIGDHGRVEELGSCFNESERRTNVEIALIHLQKPGTSYEAEFEGFFLEEEPEEAGEIGLMPYNVVRDLVNRYVQSIKIFDQQIEQAVLLNNVLSGYFSHDTALTLTKDGAPQSRIDFKKSLQISGWKYIFNKLDMKKYATRGLKEDINNFVEKQTHIPFTMRNIYKMLEIVVGTQEQRMDKALMEVFDILTERYHENRYAVEGWKTNSHYLVNEKFIIPNMCYQDQRWDKGKANISLSGSYTEHIEDLLKALCYLTGDNYGDFISLSNWCGYEFKIFENGKAIATEYRYEDAERKVRHAAESGRVLTVEKIKPLYGELFHWAYFECRAYKKGTMHFKFKSQDLWAKFNQRISKLKGYPLYENVKTEPKKSTRPPVVKRPGKTAPANVLFTFNF